MKSSPPQLHLVDTDHPVIVECREPPFPFDAMVVEEDTSLVLSANPTVRDPGEHPIRLMTALHAQVDQVPGQVLIRKGRPLRMLAIVHDLEQEPTIRTGWVAEALGTALGICRERKIKALGMEMLGCRHGRLGPETFWSLLGAAMNMAGPEAPQRIWVRTE